MNLKEITKRRIEAAIVTLADVSTLEVSTPDDADLIDESVRDEISHVIFVLDQLAEMK